MKKPQNPEKSREQNSLKPELNNPWQFGLNRRAFLRAGGSLPLLAWLPGCGENTPSVKPSRSQPQADQPQIFTDYEKSVIQVVQQHLLPDDGDGPDAEQINAFGYLQYAMQDATNQADGDPEFLKKGVGWLSDLAKDSQGDAFLNLNLAAQAKLLSNIAQSRAGENWLSLLLYYLMEALLLDPVYGGNTEGSGWRWLEHQPGFPRPVAGKTYRDFNP